MQDSRPDPELEPVAPGCLWSAVLQTTEHATAVGTLHTIDTSPVFVDDGGIRFVVRVAANLLRKEQDRRERTREAQKTGRRRNPFLPPEPEMTVGAIAPRHVGVLNKFNVLNHHLLIVTREFEHQDTLLTRDDLEALWRCLGEYDSLGFYNGGRIAGASQPHKHLQLVPVEATGGGCGLPIAPLIERAPPGTGNEMLPGVPFLHRFARLGAPWDTNPTEAAAEMMQCYRSLLEDCGIRVDEAHGEKRPSMPYNLLVTQTWMLLAPRTRECCDSIPVNSLGYAGSLFVQREEDLERVRRIGPMEVLRRVSLPLP